MRSCGATVLIHLQLSIYITAVAAIRDGSDRPDVVGVDVDVAAGDYVVFSVGRIVAREMFAFLAAFFGIFDALTDEIYRSNVAFKSPTSRFRRYIPSQCTAGTVRCFYPLNFLTGYTPPIHSRD